MVLYTKVDLLVIENKTDAPIQVRTYDGAVFLIVNTVERESTYLLV